MGGGAPPVGEFWDLGDEGALGAGRSADLGRRMVSDLIDLVVLVAMMIIVTAVVLSTRIGVGVATGGQPRRAGGVLTMSLALTIVAAWLVVHLGYWVLLEGRGGQSVGKMLTGLRAAREDGGAIGYADAFKRRVVFYLPWLVQWVPVVAGLAAFVQFGLMVGALLTYLGDVPRHQGFHDKYAHTLVVHA